MEILNFIKNYWTQIFFLGSMLVSFFIFAWNMIQATKCSLRNDILTIYDKCKETKAITRYQLQAIEYSYAIYKKLKGNSFVDDIVTEVRSYTIVD